MSDSDPREAPATPRPRRELWAIAALAVAVRLVHLFFVAQTPLLDYHRTFEDSDMYMFDEWARHIAAGDVLGRDTPHFLARWQLDLAPRERWDEWYGTDPVFYKAPFYAYLVAALYAVFDEPMVPLALLQIAAAGGAVFLVAAIGESLGGALVGRVGALLFALYAPAIHFDTVMLRGPWIQLASLAVTALLVRLREKPSPARAAAVGAMVGAALVVNEGFLILPFLVLGLLAWWFPSRSAVPIAAGFAVGLLVALSPVVARNVAVGAPALKLAVTGGTVYIVFNAAQTSPYFFEILDAAVAAPLLEQSNGTLAGAIRACLATFSGPAEFLRFYAARTLGILIPYENPDNLNFYYAALKSPLLQVLPAWGLLFPLTAAGFALQRKSWRTLLPLAPVALSILASILLTTSLSRYRVTLVVALIPVAAVAVVRVASWASRRDYLRLAGALAGMGLLAALASSAQARVVFQGQPAEYRLFRPAEFFMSAQMYASEGRFDEASAEMVNLLSRTPGMRARAHILVLLASFESRAGRPDTARQALEAAHRTAARNPFDLLRVGDAYRDHLRDHTTAVAIYRQAAEAAQGSPEIQASVAERIRSLVPAAPAR